MEKYANEMSHPIEMVDRQKKSFRLFLLKKGFRVHENPVILHFCRCSNQIAVAHRCLENEKRAKKNTKLKANELRNISYIDRK